MQLAVPKLRSSSGLKAFSKALQAYRCDLEAWRERERLSPAQTALLDAEDGAGWDLAQALLRPRKLEVNFLSPVYGYGMVYTQCKGTFGHGIHT